MQAEPWVDDDIRLVSPANPSPNLPLDKFEENIDYGRRTGADRVYLWGAEWWSVRAGKFGDRTWMDLGRAAIALTPRD